MNMKSLTSWEVKMWKTITFRSSIDLVDFLNGLDVTKWKVISSATPYTGETKIVIVYWLREPK